MVGITPDISAGILRFEKREGVFKILANRARQNWLSAMNKKEQGIDFDFA